MFDCCSVTTALIALAVGLIFRYWYKRPKNFPPGPRGVPLLGVMPYVGDRPEEVFKKWSKTYGTVFSVKMANENWVILNSFDDIEQALVKQGSDFSGRPDSSVMTAITEGLGIALLDYGKMWKSQRTFGINTLRGFGVGKKDMEGNFAEELEYLYKEIQKHEGKPFDILHVLVKSISNNICRVVFGERFEYDDPRYVRMLYLLEANINDPKKAMMFGILMFAPYLAYIPPFKSFMAGLSNDIKELLGIFEKLVKEHEKLFDSENPRDFIDCYLREQKRNRQLLQYIRDLFEGGTETTTSTLRWSFLCMLHYPLTQEKLFAEVDKILGQDGKATYALKDDMPYVCAFIEEVFRFRALLPMSVPHATSTNVDFKGYNIPKGTTVMPNLYAVHFDETFWNEPEKFMPERHINEDGKFVKSGHVIPFSVGPRHCLGEQMARMEVFVYLVSLVQKFEFLPDPNSNDLPVLNDGCRNLMFVPFKYKFVARER